MMDIMDPFDDEFDRNYLIIYTNAFDMHHHFFYLVGIMNFILITYDGKSAIKLDTNFPNNTNY